MPGHTFGFAFNTGRLAGENAHEYIKKITTKLISNEARFTAIGQGAVNNAECLSAADLSIIEPNCIIIDQDASAGDILDDLEKGIMFIRNTLQQSEEVNL